MSEDVGLGALFDMHSEGVGRHWIKILHTFSENGRHMATIRY
jgi:hypothetical protein